MTFHFKYLLNNIFYTERYFRIRRCFYRDVFIDMEKADTFNINLGNLVSWFQKLQKNKANDRLRSKSFRRSSETDIENIFLIFLLIQSLTILFREFQNPVNRN